MSGSDPFRAPTAAELLELAARDQLALTDAEAAELEPVVASFVGSLNELARHPAATAGEPATAADGRRVLGRPERDDDPYNAFTTLCEVSGAAEGPLAGMRVGIKDNVDVAGVPTTNGSSTTPHTPAHDAVVVERILAAGGSIVGKLNMDAWSAGATGETSAFGPTLHPLDRSRTPGGSSSGSAVALATDAVDLALGGDQGGSARIPASFCGVVAVKATHGCVPTHGMAHIDHTIDFLCPMGRTVEDAAKLLGVVAGPDQRDPQWVRDWPDPDAYLEGLREAPREPAPGLRVVIPAESIDPEFCAPAVLEGIRRSAGALARRGHTVEHVSIPEWRIALPVTQSLLCHLAGGTITSEGASYGHLGAIDAERVEAFARVRRNESERFPPYVKVWLLTARHLHDEHLNLSYALLHTLRRRIRDAISTALERADLLLTPTTPITAPPLLPRDADAAALASRVLQVLPYNTSPLNLSGHPAVAVPNGFDSDGLPTSAQVVARRWEEALALGAAQIVAQHAHSTVGGRQ